jgi:hypothetical protein
LGMGMGMGMGLGMGMGRGMGMGKLIWCVLRYILYCKYHPCSQGSFKVVSSKIQDYLLYINECLRIRRTAHIKQVMKTEPDHCISILP